eukprot:6472703-Amphidinium_carterae.1
MMFTMNVETAIECSMCHIVCVLRAMQDGLDRRVKVLHIDKLLPQFKPLQDGLATELSTATVSEINLVALSCKLVGPHNIGELHLFVKCVSPVEPHKPKSRKKRTHPDDPMHDALSETDVDEDAEEEVAWSDCSSDVVSLASSADSGVESDAEGE